MDPKKIQRAMDKVLLWRPGEAAVTDLGRFRGCVHRSQDGVKATKAFDEYEAYAKSVASPAMIRKKYSTPRQTPPDQADGFLGMIKTEVKTKQDGKKQTYECSSFSYSAVAELLLDDEIRENYDVLQVGSMYINQGYGNTYAHNIAVIVPKGSEVPTPDGQLPKGSLIIDPWARAMGYPVDQSLAVPPEKFAYKSSLYPMKVNYNSANEENLEETVQQFKSENPELLQKKGELLTTSSSYSSGKSSFLTASFALKAFGALCAAAAGAAIAVLAAPAVVTAIGIGATAAIGAAVGVAAAGIVKKGVEKFKEMKARNTQIHPIEEQENLLENVDAPDEPHQPGGP